MRTKLTLASPLLDDLHSRRHQYSQVQQAGHKGGSKRQKRVQATGRVEQATDTGGHTEEWASGEGQGQDNRQSRLQSEVNGEHVVLDC